MLSVIIGPMFAGKTTEMCRRVHKYELGKRRVMVVKHSLDTRYSDENIIYNHEKHKLFSDNIVSASRLADVRDELSEVEVIGIDEGQFYPDLVDEVLFHLRNGKRIIISALDSDYNQELFLEVAKLLPYANTFEKHTAVCDCGEDATATIRLNRDEDRIKIGGKDEYGVRCINCL